VLAANAPRFNVAAFVGRGKDPRSYGQRTKAICRQNKIGSLDEERKVATAGDVTGSMNHVLLLQRISAAENRLLRAKLPTKLPLSNPERAALAEIGKRLDAKCWRGRLRRQT